MYLYVFQTVERWTNLFWPLNYICCTLLLYTVLIDSPGTHLKTKTKFKKSLESNKLIYVTLVYIFVPYSFGRCLFVLNHQMCKFIFIWNGLYLKNTRFDIYLSVVTHQIHPVTLKNKKVFSSKVNPYKNHPCQ